MIIQDTADATRENPQQPNQVRKYEQSRFKHHTGLHHPLDLPPGGLRNPKSTAGHNGEGRDNRTT